MRKPLTPVEQNMLWNRARIELNLVAEKRMQQHADKGGWREMQPKELTRGAYQNVAWLHNNIPNTADPALKAAYIEQIADAMNYLVMLRDVLTIEAAND